MPVSINNIRTTLQNLRARSSFNSIETSVDQSIRQWLLLNLTKIGTSIDSVGEIRSLTQEVDDPRSANFGDGIAIHDKNFPSGAIDNIADYEFDESETLALTSDQHTGQDDDASSSTPVAGTICTGMSGTFSNIPATKTFSEVSLFLGQESDGGYLDTFVFSGSLEDMTRTLQRAGENGVVWKEGVIRNIVSSYSYFDSEGS